MKLTLIVILEVDRYAMKSRASDSVFKDIFCFFIVDIMSETMLGCRSGCRKKQTLSAKLIRRTLIVGHTFKVDLYVESIPYCRS